MNAAELEFEFTSENLERFQAILQRYPYKRAALLPALHLAQEQQGYISPGVECYVGRLLDVPEVDVHEVVTFYTLYFQKPMGRHHIRVCMSISCTLCGCETIRDYLGKKLGVPSGGVTDDGKFSWEAIPDCLGACEIAPMLQLDEEFYGNLTPEKVDQLLNQVE